MFNRFVVVFAASFIFASSGAYAGGHVAPSQFIAKLYTEVLGRAPDGTGWRGYTDYFKDNGCNRGTLQNVVTWLFSEFSRSRGATPEEAALVMYRAILSREPDVGGFNANVGALRKGVSVVTLAQNITKSTEFGNLVGQICAGAEYRRNWNGNPPINIGGGTWTHQQLVNCVTANRRCTIPQRKVVYVTSQVILPSGHILETAGNPNPTHYFRMARLVRQQSQFPNQTDGEAIIRMSPSSVVQNIWLDGQRGQMPPAPETDGTAPNIYIVHGAGNEASHSVVRYTRSESPFRRTNIATWGLSGRMTIHNNLITNYAAVHEWQGYQVADGISNHGTNSRIYNNHIVDSTDVSIVVFGQNNAVQRSEVWNNVIVQAGNSASGGVVLDPSRCSGSPCAFAGNGVHDNLFVVGRQVHIDVLLSNGIATWFGSSSCPGTQCGSGGRMVNNNTLWYEKVHTQVAIAVDGMLSATTTPPGSMFFEITPTAPPGHTSFCYEVAKLGNGIVNDPNHSSGNLFPGVSGSLNLNNLGCVYHP